MPRASPQTVGLRAQARRHPDPRLKTTACSQGCVPAPGCTAYTPWGQTASRCCMRSRLALPTPATPSSRRVISSRAMPSSPARPTPPPASRCSPPALTRPPAPARCSARPCRLSQTTPVRPSQASPTKPSRTSTVSPSTPRPWPSAQTARASSAMSTVPTFTTSTRPSRSWASSRRPRRCSPSPPATWSSRRRAPGRGSCRCSSRRCRASAG